MALAEAVKGIRYSNFKDSVGERSRHDCLHGRLERDVPISATRGVSSSTMQGSEATTAGAGPVVVALPRRSSQTP